MPKRLLDGEKLWRSDKLLKIQSGEIRAEYANLLPLALADGSFECDPARVWAQVYAYNRPYVTVDKVQSILDELERVKLLFRWTDRDKKQWGFWVGIDKDGLLPSESQRGRYKVGKIPPKDKFNVFINKDIEETPEHIQSESRVGQAGLAIGLPLHLEGVAGADMSFKNNITDKARKILGARILSGDPGWDEMNSLKRVYGATIVRDAFVEWAESVKGESISYPLTEFIRIADGRLQGHTGFQGHTGTTAAGKLLILDLAFLSDCEVTFTQKQSFEIERLLETYPKADIKAAFLEFVGNLDEFSKKFAGKDFSEKAEQILYARKRRQEKNQQTAQLVEDTIAHQRAKTEAEIAAQPKPIDFENFQF